MASNTEVATSKVLLDGKQAEDELKQLKQLAQETRKEYEKLKLSKDPEAAKKLKETRDLEKQVKALDQSYYGLDKVLKNMNGSSLKDLQKAQRELNAEIRKQTRNTDEDRTALKILQDQYNKVGNEIDSVKGSMKKMGDTSESSGNSFKSIAGKMGQFVASLGIATGAMEIVKGVLFATDTVSDKFEETIGGLKTGMSYLARSIATLDFSNFLTNMASAITAGRDYVKTLDQIGDRTRSIGILESKDRERLADLLIIRKDVTKTDKERIEAGKKILNIEQNNAERRKSLTKDQLDNELKYASKMTGLSKERIGQLLIEQETNRGAIEKANAFNQAVESKRVAEIGASGATMYGQSSTPIINKETLNIINSASPAIKKLADELKSFGKLNEDEYTRIAAAYQNIGEANAYYAESTAKTQVGMAKLMKGQLEENESEVKKYTANVAKEVEKEIGSYAKLNSEIGDLEEQFRNLKASNQPVPDDLLHQIISKKGELKEIEESVKAIGEGIALMSMKQAGVVIPGVPTQPGSILKKRNIDISTGAPEGTEKGLDLGFNKMDAVEKKDYALEQASVIQGAIFDIVKINQQAALDNKLSILEKEKAGELNNKNLTEQQKLEIEEKYSAKARKIKQDAFKKQRAADIIQGIINTALAVVKALPNIPLSIAAGVAGAASIAVIASQPVPEFAKGRYNVTGAQTGKEYNNIPYTGPAVTGLYTQPALVGESGAEMIIDAPTTRNIRMNFPEIIEAINHSKVNQFAAGRYPEKSVNKSDVNANIILNTELLKSTNALLQKLDKEGITAKGIWILNDLEKIQKNKKSIEDSTNM